MFKVWEKQKWICLRKHARSLVLEPCAVSEVAVVGQTCFIFPSLCADVTAPRAGCESLRCMRARRPPRRQWRLIDSIQVRGHRGSARRSTFCVVWKEVAAALHSFSRGVDWNIPGRDKHSHCGLCNVASCQPFRGRCIEFTPLSAFFSPTFTRRYENGWESVAVKEKNEVLKGRFLWCLGARGDWIPSSSQMRMLPWFLGDMWRLCLVSCCPLVIITKLQRFLLRFAQFWGWLSHQEALVGRWGGALWGHPQPGAFAGSERGAKWVKLVQINPL